MRDNKTGAPREVPAYHVQPVQAYLSDLGRVELLKADEERSLARDIERIRQEGPCLENT